MFLKLLLVCAGIAENIVVVIWLPILELKLPTGKQAKMHRKEICAK